MPRVAKRMCSSRLGREGVRKTAKFTKTSIWKPIFHLIDQSTWTSTCLSLRRWESRLSREEKKIGAFWGPEEEERVFCCCCLYRKDMFSFCDLIFINRCLPFIQTPVIGKPASMQTPKQTNSTSICQAGHMATAEGSSVEWDLSYLSLAWMIIPRTLSWKLQSCLFLREDKICPFNLSLKKEGEAFP